MLVVLLAPTLTPTPTPTQVFCGNFEYDAREREIEKLFDKFGDVERVDMKTGGWRLEMLERVVAFPPGGPHCRSCPASQEAPSARLCDQSSCLSIPPRANA